MREKPPTKCGSAQKPSSRLLREFIGDSSLAVTLEDARRSPCNAESCNIRSPGSSTRAAYPYRRPSRLSCDDPGSGSQPHEALLEAMEEALSKVTVRSVLLMPLGGLTTAVTRSRFTTYECRC